MSSAEERECPLQALEDHLHRLPPEELQPQDAREAQYDQERMAPAPRKLKIRKIDLALVIGRLSSHSAPRGPRYRTSECDIFGRHFCAILGRR